MFLLSMLKQVMRQESPDMNKVRVSHLQSSQWCTLGELVNREINRIDATGYVLFRNVAYFYNPTDFKCCASIFYEYKETNNNDDSKV